ncbi:MAG: DUF4275 family protein [Thermoleophilia bacterium]
MKLFSEQERWLKINNFQKTDIECILDVRETNRLKIEWRKKFIPEVKNPKYLHYCPKCQKPGKEIQRSYDWHSFSFKIVSAERVSGEYLKKIHPENIDVYLYWEECDTNGFIMNFDKIRRCKWTTTDIYIFDKSFSWTFVATHEDWFFYKKV